MAPMRRLVAFATASIAVAAVAAGTCTDAEGDACTAGVAPVEDAGLLQVARGGARRSVDSTKVWAELKAAVQMDKLKAAIKMEDDPKLVQPLQERLSMLQQGFPATSDMKKHFAEQWTNISMVVNMEEVQQRLQDAKNLGSEEAVALKKQLHELQTHLPEGMSSSVQDQAAGSWGYLQDSGVPLPDLDQVTSKSMEVANAAMDTAGWVYSSSAYVGGTMASTYGSVAKDVIGDIDAGDIAHSMQDAAGEAAHKAGDLAGRVQGWMR